MNENILKKLPLFIKTRSGGKPTNEELDNLLTVLQNHEAGNCIKAIPYTLHKTQVKVGDDEYITVEVDVQDCPHRGILFGHNAIYKIEAERSMYWLRQRIEKLEDVLKIAIADDFEVLHQAVSGWKAGTNSGLKRSTINKLMDLLEEKNHE